MSFKVVLFALQRNLQRHQQFFRWAQELRQTSSVLLEFQEIDAKSQIWKQFDSSQTDLCRRMAGRALARSFQLTYKKGESSRNFGLSIVPSDSKDDAIVSLWDVDGIELYSFENDVEFTSLRKWLTSILIPNPKSEMVPPIPMTSSRFIPNFKFLYNRDVSWLKIDDLGNCESGSELFENYLVVSGSFNPMHKGHLEMSESSLIFLQKQFGITNVKPCFEMPVTNADKGFLALDEFKVRLAQFAGLSTIICTLEPLFVNKMKSFKNSFFVVGWDTAIRILDPKYYDNSVENLIRILESVKERGCKFLVVGREVNGKFNTANELIQDNSKPSIVKDVFLALPEFRNDISSTQLRSSGVFFSNL